MKCFGKDGESQPSPGIAPGDHPLQTLPWETWAPDPGVLPLSTILPVGALNSTLPYERGETSEGKRQNREDGDGGSMRSSYARPRAAAPQTHGHSPAATQHHSLPGAMQGDLRIPNSQNSPFHPQHYITLLRRSGPASHPHGQHIYSSSV